MQEGNTCVSVKQNSFGSSTSTAFCLSSLWPTITGDSGIVGLCQRTCTRFQPQRDAELPESASSHRIHDADVSRTAPNVERWFVHPIFGSYGSQTSETSTIVGMSAAGKARRLRIWPRRVNKLPWVLISHHRRSI